MSMDKETLLEEHSDEYENVVKMDYSWKCELMDGNEGAFCKCGMVLQIKRPKVKAWHKIKCPKCGFIINIFCGEYSRATITGEVEGSNPS